MIGNYRHSMVVIRELYSFVHLKLNIIKYSALSMISAQIDTYLCILLYLAEAQVIKNSKAKNH